MCSFSGSRVSNNENRERVNFTSASTDCGTADKKTTDFLFSSMDSGMVAFISVAVRNLLEHEKYNLPDLAHCVCEMHPIIPDEIVEIVVVTAAAAARHVAKKHYARERYLNSGQDYHQVLVVNVSNAKFRWFPGFSSRTSERMKISEPDHVVKDPRNRSFTRELHRQVL
jgi:hypothetical protein